jgi:hypothetical protein
MDTLLQYAIQYTPVIGGLLVATVLIVRAEMSRRAYRAKVAKRVRSV